MKGDGHRRLESKLPFQQFAVRAGTRNFMACSSVKLTYTTGTSFQKGNSHKSSFVPTFSRSNTKSL